MHLMILLIIMQAMHQNFRYRMVHYISCRVLLNGVSGRFEWIIQNGNVTIRLFVKGGEINGIPIMP